MQDQEKTALIFAGEITINPKEPFEFLHPFISNFGSGELDYSFTHDGNISLIVTTLSEGIDYSLNDFE